MHHDYIMSYVYHILLFIIIIITIFIVLFYYHYFFFVSCLLQGRTCGARPQPIRPGACEFLLQTWIKCFTFLGATQAADKARRLGTYSCAQVTLPSG